MTPHRAAASIYTALALLALLGVGPVNKGTTVTLDGGYGRHDEAYGCYSAPPPATHATFGADVQHRLDDSHLVLGLGLHGAYNLTPIGDEGSSDVIIKPKSRLRLFVAPHAGLAYDAGGLDLGFMQMALPVPDELWTLLPMPAIGGYVFPARPFYLFAQAAWSTAVFAMPWRTPPLRGGIGWHGETLRAQLGTDAVVFTDRLGGFAALDFHAAPMVWIGLNGWIADRWRYDTAGAQWSTGLRFTFEFDAAR